MYNVLNMEGDKIVVETINPQIHKHLSGREFTENDACVKKTPMVKKEQMAELKIEVIEELSREQAIEAYKEKYGKKPSHMMKTENIIAKL